jgi:hypothetical protein
MRHALRFAASAAFATVATMSAAHAAKTTVDTRSDGRTFVSAPGTRVAVQPKRTTVRVEAPYSSVRVNTASNHVRIRVPYFNGDIRW